MVFVCIFFIEICFYFSILDGTGHIQEWYGKFFSSPKSIFTEAVNWENNLSYPLCGGAGVCSINTFVIAKLQISNSPLD